MNTQKASLSFTGDILCHREQLAACRTDSGFEFRPILEPAAEVLAAADFLVGNLETLFAGKEAGYTSELYSFNTPDDFARMLASAGFDLVSTANNHCLDRELPGLKRTLDVLDREGISHTGTARSPGERERVCLREINGIRTAFLSCTMGPPELCRLIGGLGGAFGLVLGMTGACALLLLVAVLSSVGAVVP